MSLTAETRKTRSKEFLIEKYSELCTTHTPPSRESTRAKHVLSLVEDSPRRTVEGAKRFRSKEFPWLA